MRHLALLALVAGLLAMVPCALRAQGEFALKWVDAEPGDPLTPGNRVFHMGSEGRPPDLKAPPQAASATLLYFQYQVGGTLVLAVLDPTSPQKLYVDTDGGRDLSQAVGLPARAVEGASSFGPVTIRAAGSKESAGIRVRFLSYSPWRHMAIAPGGYMAGEASLAGKKHRIALVDSNLDGRYDKVAVAPDSSSAAAADTVAINTNQDGKFSPAWQEGGEIQPLLAMFHVGDAYYRAEPAPGGESVRLTQVQPQFGALDTGCPDLVLSVLGDAGFHRLGASAGKWRLPAGKYRATGFSLARTDADGGGWVLRQYSSAVGGLANFEVRPGEATTLKAGTPLASKLTVRKLRNGSVYMTFQPVGQAGEGYEVHAYKDARSQPAPGVRILDETGKVLTVDKFAYE